MSQYDTTLDLTVSNTSHAQIIDLIGGNKTVLDVGCATGYLAQALRARGCTVSGVEYDAEAAEMARPHLDLLVVGDLVTLDVESAFGDRRFDAIVLGDVLEHLADSDPVLARLTTLLAPGGSVVISVPNVAHGSLRLALLQGRWQYRELGLLDRTHLRFFTRSSLMALLADAGLCAVEIRTTVLDPLGCEVEVDAESLPEGIVDWVRAQRDAMTYQFVVRAVVNDAAGAALAAARERDELREQLTDAERHAAQLEGRLQEARAATARLMSTRTMRILAAPRALYARLRRALGRTP